MVTILALLALAFGVFIRVYAVSDEFNGTDEEKAEMKEVGLYFMIGGVVIILINSWIIKPIMVIFGG